ncbi:MAG: response regulator [Spirochaetes bacterium]|nr:response regulator [Spirochaetota bacterium]
MANIPVDLSNINQRIPDGLSPEGAPYRILVVDDSKFVIKQITQILTSEKYDVCGCAEDGAEGVALYKELKPDLVTMDITMPKLDGLSALVQVIEFDPKARVIVVSALGKEETVKHALLKGAKNFIVKPFDRAKVLERVRNVLKGGK